MNAEFENKVILITGSSSGIGKNTAIAFAKLGARVVINGRDEAKIGKTVEECMKASRNKQNVLAVKADLSDSNEIKRLVEETVKKWNRIDVLINCASMNEAGGNIMAENMLEMYEKHFVGKTRAYLQMCHLCAPYVIESEGVIINISGTSGKQPCTIDYMSCLTEAAIDSMTKTLALELGPKGVRVNSVNPSVIKTPAMNVYFNEEQEKQFVDFLSSRYPMRRIGTMDDMTDCFLFLSSKKASFITGSNIAVDGGALLVSSPFDEFFK